MDNRLLHLIERITDWCEARLSNCKLLQLTPQMRILVAIEPIDGRKGIDSLA